MKNGVKVALSPQVILPKKYFKKVDIVIDIDIIVNIYYNVFFILVLMEEKYTNLQVKIVLFLWL